MQRPELIIIATHAKFIISHRLDLLKDFAKLYKMKVYVGSSRDDNNHTDIKKLESFGFYLAHISRIIVKELFSVRFRKKKIFYIIGLRQIILCLPILILKKQYDYYLVISGLGNLFHSHNFLAKLLKYLFEKVMIFYSNKRSLSVIVQNAADQRYFQEELKLSRVLKVRGSGVDLDKYNCNWHTKRNEVVFIGRLIKEKGINEFVVAAKNLCEKYPDWQFSIYGDFYRKNPTALTPTELENMLKDSLITYCGYADDPSVVYKQAKIICVPSYHEGLPKTILEACAAGCAIVTTDARGCVEAITDGVHGVIVSTADPTSLEKGLESVLCDDTQLALYAKNSKILAKQEFALVPINQAILKFVQEGKK